MKNPILSIIVPIYNVELYLVDCLESIINQSFKDFELILIDDGSTDLSGKIIDEYVVKDDRINVIHQKNAGLSAARNAGLDLAIGQYITFVDSDDLIQNGTYKENLEILLHDQSLDFLQFPLCRFDKIKPKISQKDIHSRVIIGQNNIFTNWWEDDVLNGPVWNKIYSRRIFDSIRFPLGSYFEDLFLLVDFSEIVNKVCISNCGCYFYRVREGSITDKFSQKKHVDLFIAHFKVYKKMYSFENLKPSRVRAFSRVFRKLITIKFVYPKSDLTSCLKELQLYIPSWFDVKSSKDKSEYFWIISVKILGLSTFVRAFCLYLKIKEKLHLSKLKAITKSIVG